MDRQQFYRERLAEHLDRNGDVAPPWEQFPNYERLTIGWRMGAGEDFFCCWRVFLDTLAPELEVRLAYLRRHPPAPVSGADQVYAVLHPADKEDADEQAEAEHRAELLRDGLIASDIAYSTWRSQQPGVLWLWEDPEPPEMTARYSPREFWFWSRQIAELRGTADWQPPTVPTGWEVCREPLETGVVYAPDLRQGLRTLAQMLSAGRVVPPWLLGLGTNTFEDSFKMDMGFADSFRLWGMSAFDDREQMYALLGDVSTIPESWQRWISEHFFVD